ncbi:MAG TPA: hypothetical protein VGE97_03515 [Nitrososphaera sp.]|jgi:hypothetical protein
MKRVRKLEHKSYSKLDISGLNRSALWGARDYDRVRHEFAKIRRAGFMARVARAEKDVGMYNEYRTIECKLLRDWESKLDRIWNDRKTGTHFSKGDRIEPHELVIVANTVMWDGTRLFALFCVGLSEDFFRWFAMGDNAAQSDLSMTQLVSEVARANMDTDGIHTADGNVIKYAIQFGPGVPNTIVREFGGFNDEAAGDMCFRATLPDDSLEQLQGDTFVTANHNIVTNPR